MEFIDIICSETAGPAAAGLDFMSPYFMSSEIQ